ncbi:uroporphyrinogen-III C-methyltransferase [bacterium]|nr:uroporphyrinogen-III C-methyltransferase [bacterium]
MANGMIYIVGAGPGDPNLITVKGLHLLKQADVVLADHLAHPQLLSYCRAQASIIDVGKKKGKHSITQKEINENMLSLAKAGNTVVRLKGGDPFIFGRLGEEMEWLTQHGIAYEIVPGVSSAIAGPGYTGIPLTHRQISRSVAFMTGTQIKGQSAEAIPNTDTLVCLMGYHQLDLLIPKLIACSHFSKKTPIALLSKATYPDQKSIEATLGTVLNIAKKQPLETPVLLVVGEVVKCAETCAWFQKTVFHKRIILCRQTGNCDHWLKPLQDHNIDVIHAPVIETTYQTNHGLTTSHITESDYVIMSSAKGVYYSINALLELGLDTRSLAQKTIISLGPQVTKALQQYGLTPDIEAAQANQAGIIATLPHSLHGKTILYLTSTEADTALKHHAEEKGAIVNQRSLYQPQSRNCNYLSLSPNDWIVVFSPSAVMSICKHTHWPKSNVMIALGKQTATALKKAGFKHITSLETPTPEALLNLIHHPPS